MEELSAGEGNEESDLLCTPQPILMKPKICFLDVETTGTSHVKHGVIQIGGMICSDEEQACVTLEEFCFPCAPFPTDLIEDEALAVSGFSREQINGFPPPAAVHASLTSLFEKHCNKFDRKDKMIFAGYNAPFDYGFLRKWFEKAGDRYFGSWFWHPAVDVMSLAMLRLAEFRHEMPDFKLVTVAAKLDIPIERAHNALEDVRATKSIFEKVR